MVQVTGAHRSQYDVAKTSSAVEIQRWSPFLNIVTSNIYAFLVSAHPLGVSFHIPVVG